MTTGTCYLPRPTVFDHQELCSFNFQERHWFNFVLKSPVPLSSLIYSSSCHGPWLDPATLRLLQISLDFIFLLKS